MSGLEAIPAAIGGIQLLSFFGSNVYVRTFIIIVILAAIGFLVGMILEYKYHWITQVFQKIGLENFESGSSDMAPLGRMDPSGLSPGAAMSLSTEKLLSEFVPVQSDSNADAAWANIPSQTCLASDQGEKLKPSRSYYQRTNNYKRTHPDDCSAPFHEMLGTFYAPTLGVGATAPSGLPLPGGLVECNGPAPVPKGWGGVGSLE
jgi:hypothetical protein